MKAPQRIAVNTEQVWGLVEPLASLEHNALTLPVEIFDSESISRILGQRQANRQTNSRLAGGKSVNTRFGASVRKARRFFRKFDNFEK